MAKPKKGKKKAKSVDYEPPLRGEHIRSSTGEGWDARKRHRAKMKKAGPGWLEKESSERHHRSVPGRRNVTPTHAPNMEEYGGKGWEKAKKNPGKVVRHPESRRGSKD